MTNFLLRSNSFAPFDRTRKSLSNTVAESKFNILKISKFNHYFTYFEK